MHDERSYYGPHQRLELSIEIPEDGMLVAELTHQADEDVEIYFDDFSFNQLQEGFEVLQRMDYYPFGMPMAHSYKNDTRSQNRYWYNAGSRYNDSTGHYQMHYKHYDATLGRFNVVDPYANEFANLENYTKVKLKYKSMQKELTDLLCMLLIKIYKKMLNDCALPRSYSSPLVNNKHYCRQILSLQA